VPGRARVLELRPGTELFLTHPRQIVVRERCATARSAAPSPAPGRPVEDHCNWKFSLKR
jgi:hypothetical protein